MFWFREWSFWWVHNTVLLITTSVIHLVLCLLFHDFWQSKHKNCVEIVFSHYLSCLFGIHHWTGCEECTCVSTLRHWICVLFLLKSPVIPTALPSFWCWRGFRAETSRCPQQKLQHHHSRELSRRKCSVCHGLSEGLMSGGAGDQKFHKLELASDSRRNRTKYLRFRWAPTAQRLDFIQVETASPIPFDQPLNGTHLWLFCEHWFVDVQKLLKPGVWRG